MRTVNGIVVTVTPIGLDKLRWKYYLICEFSGKLRFQFARLTMISYSCCVKYLIYTPGIFLLPRDERHHARAD
jgi:hypothetical protein